MVPRLAATILLLVSFAASLPAEVLLDAKSKPVRYAGNYSSAKVEIPPYREKRVEFRGAWVATVENLDFAVCKDAASFRSAYTAIVRNLQRANFNAIIFQVRPTCDAFYPSRHAPWSRWMSGAEGRNLGDFDPLAFMVDEAHRHNLVFYAWLNPYRVTGNTKLAKGEYLKKLDAKSFAKRNPHLVLSTPTGKGNLLFLDPGEPAVVSHIADVVGEIVDRYQVDGIVFDDYFYPYHDIKNIDAGTFAVRNPGKLSLADWRRSNVTAAIRAVRETIDRANKKRRRKVVFGVSPFGIWANKSSLAAGSLSGGKQSYFTQFADTRGWVREQLVDFISPQLYWEFSHNVAAYAALTDWWCETVRGTGVRLYISQAASRLGSGPEWKSAELVNQLRYNSGRPEVSGTVFYAYRHIFRPANPSQKAGAEKIMQLWRYPAAVPDCPTVRMTRGGAAKGNASQQNINIRREK